MVVVLELDQLQNHVSFGEIRLTLLAVQERVNFHFLYYNFSNLRFRNELLM